MGSLYDRDKQKMEELRQSYQGILVILRSFISNDEYTENHCYRVSIYAVKIASYLGFSMERIEDIRSAAFLHDIGKLEISRNLLYKAARLNEEEYKEIKQHVAKSEEILNPLQGPLGRILPIILAHHEKVDGSGYNKVPGEKIPLEARVLAVADVYDSLTSDRPYRKAMSPFDAKEIIEKGSGTEFDPKVVKAFLKAFAKGELEIPNVVL
jgi:HD-GYP domain-containing protein (c-di-GMP phosphodiesterase class II)